ncbi:nck-associated protein 5-like isoform X2 [Eucyclogobius newberryi]|uniref:nck-associated protein 5-like isoform X2 n=1 Tax=Eucyclogobius newberryi TaxID=166745 RepID=UPI003B5B21F0
MFWEPIKGSAPDRPSSPEEREGAWGGSAGVRRGNTKVCASPREIRGRMNKRWERREHFKRLALDSGAPEYMDANKCIDELLRQLEEERRNVRREKLAVARLQREAARSKSEETMREKLIHELEEERHLRLESEKRLREVTEDSEHGRAHMVSLQQQFSRMEETVRSLLQNQGLEPTGVDTVDLMKAYKDKLTEEVKKQHGVTEEEEGSVSRSQTVQELLLSTSEDLEMSQAEDKTKLLLERLKTLEDKNSALAMENENQREQYERCLDEVANQVVQALLTQKDLREECVKLRTRVFDLEQQNRALGVLFQQKIKPASDLLLQKLHSKIMDLSAADLLLEPERSKAFLQSRSTDSPSIDVQVNGKAGFMVTKCVSQLSLTAPERPLYRRSSCSSSEISLSSACSDFSSGSYTWNDGRSAGKMSSLTWEKRLSLGSSAPSNIHNPPEEQVPTRRKECRILEGLRKLQRRKHRSASASRVSKSGKEKDCMNSNEGIYSLSFKGGAKDVSKTGHVSRAAGSKRFSYDSDDADDELVQSNRGDNIPTKDSWFQCRKSHSISESLCSWEGLQDTAPTGNIASDPIAPKHPPGYDSKDRPEKLLSFINSFLPEGERKSAFSRPCKLRVDPPECPNQLLDMDDTDELISESSDIQLPLHPQVVDREPKRFSRDSAKFLPHQHLRKDKVRTQSADGRPIPFSLVKDPKIAKQCTQSEESILAIFDAEGEPIELCVPECMGVSVRLQQDTTKVLPDYTELIPQERPTRQKCSRNYTVLESPEKPSEFQSRIRIPSRSREASEERLSMQMTPQRKLIKPPSSRVSKGLSIPPMYEPAGAKTGGSKIPGRNIPSASPLRVSKGTTTEPTMNSGPAAQDKSPLSPTVKVPRFVKSQGINCTQSPRSVKLPSRVEWTKRATTPGSPQLARRHLEFTDNGEQPTRDKHCDASKSKLRSPSPPPPPGRTTSLLVRPNYENSPQIHKSSMAHQSTTVRGPPPSYNQANMQATLPIKDKDCSDFDAGYGTALAPQKLVDKTSQHLQKSPAITQTKGTSKRLTKDYLPSANSGCVPEPESKPSKNVPPPYSALRGFSFQNSFATKRGSSQEHQIVQKTSISLPISLQESSQVKTEMPKAIISPPSSVVTSPNAKSRIPMGFKAFLKSPPCQKSSISIPGKLEKDHINSVSKETVTTNASIQCDSSFDPASPTTAEAKLDDQVEDVHLEEGGGKRGSQLFSRSISVTTKSHLKPALGMTGAKARSQSFSTNYLEKPSINTTDIPGRIRTQIITNSGDRGNSLSRQSSLEVPQVESPMHSPRSRVSHYGGMTGSNSHNILPERTSKCDSKDEDCLMGEGVTSPSKKEARSLPISDRASNGRKPSKVASHPQFQPPSYSSENPMCETLRIGACNDDPDYSREEDSTKQPLDVDDKKTSPTACTIEERVMMGIEENLQKCQEQEKVAANETKKTGPSLANWFGLRKSKLPALSGKKADAPKRKEEKKELKIGSVLGGKQIKSEKKKEKKKSDGQQEGPTTNLAEVNNKLSTIMDHCNNQMGQIASQIQCTTAFIGKEQLVKEILGRTTVKGSSVAAPHGISTPKKQVEMDGEICHDSSVLIMSPKLHPKAENNDGNIMDSSCQDHMIDSSCQMRTLDSGIGTFPLPKSESCGPLAPMTSDPSELASSSSQPEDVAANTAPPPYRLGHSLSDTTVTRNNKVDVQSRLPKLSSSDAIRTKRSSMCTSRGSASAEEITEAEKSSRSTEQEMPGERALRVCTYSGSSSETETEPTESPRRSKTCPVDQSEQTLKRCSVGKGLSIMDYYQQEVFPCLEEGKRLSRYSLLHQEEALDQKPTDGLTDISLEKSSPVISNQPVSIDLSLESLNKLNQSPPISLYSDSTLKDTPDCCRVEKPCSKPGPDQAGSFTDSLYDSFSSCTSQGSNQV